MPYKFLIFGNLLIIFKQLLAISRTFLEFHCDSEIIIISKGAINFDSGFKHFPFQKQLQKF